MNNKEQILYRIVPSNVEINHITYEPEPSVFSSQGHRTNKNEPCFSVFYKSQYVPNPEAAWNLYKETSKGKAYGVMCISESWLDDLGMKFIADDIGPGGKELKGHGNVIYTYYKNGQKERC